MHEYRLFFCEWVWTVFLLHILYFIPIHWNCMLIWLALMTWWDFLFKTLKIIFHIPWNGQMELLLGVIPIKRQPVVFTAFSVLQDNVKSLAGLQLNSWFVAWLRISIRSHWPLMLRQLTTPCAYKTRVWSSFVITLASPISIPEIVVWLLLPLVNHICLFLPWYILSHGV